MSNNVNTEILEEIAEAIDNSSSVEFIEALEQALQANDLDNAIFILNSYCGACGSRKGERQF